MTTAPAASITLNPSYRLPIGIVLLSLPVLFIQLGLGLALALLGLFLLYQSTTIRLVFTPTDLEVRRNDRLLKTFPYAEWLNWQVFWPSVPILFYFKEVNSIHFLPVLFDPQQLRECLDTYCGDCAETRSQS
ncbi:DUF3119 family protein [Leptolyngbya sp. BC1307]|uniref:DUF3119 family protein n=1 Tax=Leptolyngbya sp. BC1307 TaxID=2029589 RepID=UPI000EFAF457|nr:DUF3119 family protein [Leptolyngbya sp. BC1307]